MDDRPAATLPVLLAEPVNTVQPVLPFVNLHRRHLVCGLDHRIVSFAYSPSLLHYYKVARREAKWFAKNNFGITYT